MRLHNFLQSEVDKFLTASISVSSQYGSGWLATYLTGSNQTLPSWYTDYGYPTTARVLGGSSTTGWLSVQGVSSSFALFDLDNGEGRTEVINKLLISNAGTYKCDNISVSASNDNTNWTFLTEVTSSGGNDDWILNVNPTNTPYRYFRFNISRTMNADDYMSLTHVMGWDYRDLSPYSESIFNPEYFNVTSSAGNINITNVESGTTVLEGLHTHQRFYSMYAQNRLAEWEIEFNEDVLFQSIPYLGYLSSAYYPGVIDIYVSNNPTYSDYKKITSISYTDQSPQNISSLLTVIDFEDPIKLGPSTYKYLKFVFRSEESLSEGNNQIMERIHVSQLYSASSPLPPENLTITPSGNSIYLTWDQSSSIDNTKSHLMYHISRSSDGGSTFEGIATLSGSYYLTPTTKSVEDIVQPTFYADENLPDGTYTYKIQTQHMWHFESSSYLESDATTLPANLSKKVYMTNNGKVVLNPNDTILIEVA